MASMRTEILTLTYFVFFSLIVYVKARIFDAHIHFWDLEEWAGFPNKNPSFNWPNPSTPAIYKTILPNETNIHFRPALFIQALNDSPEEIRWAQKLALSQAPFLKGIVGGLDLRKHESLVNHILEFRSHPIPLVGLRTIQDFETHPRGYFYQNDVLKGLSIVQSMGGLTIDLLVNPKTLNVVSYLAGNFPNLKFVIDHMGGPLMTERGLSTQRRWVKEIRNASKFKNVFVKLSGWVVVSRRNGVRAEVILKPFVNLLLRTFGISRCMFGSDWPVSRLEGLDYEDVVKRAKIVLRNLSSSQRDDIFFNNARQIYGITS